MQVTLLFGSDGLLPAADLFESSISEPWRAQFWIQPTLFHFSHSDLALRAATWAGMLFAVLLFFNIAPGPSALALWALYLSFVTVGRNFLGFQWDSLLLEAGALAVFLAAWRRPLWRPAARAPSWAIVILFKILIFKLNFESGISKLLTGDPTWRDLTAMDYYYETAPLPTVLGWYAHHLPHIFHALEVVATFGLELVIAWFVFGPRPARLIAFVLFVPLQAVIMSTANYGFFNLLSAAICVFLIDDALFKRLRSRFKRKTEDNVQDSKEPDEAGDRKKGSGTSISRRRPRLRHLNRAAGIAAIAVLAIVSYTEFASNFLPPGGNSNPSPPRRLSDALIAASRPMRSLFTPFRSINRYHLFATMTTQRIEVEIQGSDDGQTWETYEFKHKPGDLARRPDFVAPHQPRLDFQCWFLLIRPNAIGRHPYFTTLLTRILEGSPTIRPVFAFNPFPDQPPRYVRVDAYRYTMSSMKDHRETGVYWDREFVGRWGTFSAR